MRNKITVKEFFDKSMPDGTNYTIDRYMDLFGYIFKGMYGILDADSSSQYVKLKTYLSSKPLGSGLDKNCIYLDMLFYTRYGDKKLNVMIDNIRYPYPFEPDKELFLFDDDLGTTTVREIGRLILTRFADRWEKYLDELTLSYEPLHNYDMNEHEEVNSSITVSGNDEHTVQGFNSTTYQPESKNEDSHTSSGNAKDNYRDLNRYGNIGVTTSQQMLESEIKLRDENVFIKRLLTDVANFITVGVYD